MESPVFKLEGVIKSKNEMSDFEGPLTLILQLLSKNRIEIRDISISLILTQYLEYLDKMAALDLDIASDFVAMASHLMYIKTKMLLTGTEEISEIEQLISSLEELRRSDKYLQIKEITQSLAQMYTRGAAMLPGPPEFLPQSEVSYIHIKDDLLNALYGIIGREEAVIRSLNPRETIYPERVVFSIPEKISQVLETLKISGTVNINDLFYDSSNRTELIATLIAVLELCRVGSVFLTGTEEDLMITYTGTGRDPMVPDFTEEV